ncbi:MAG TPA: hypothetical protein VNJ08_13515 [Bacteriovoracaceae bacterium]|nr:hypothetical protein [Bacteriovoracaceae bacterium]
MTNTTCCSCHKPKANFECAICSSQICKSCTQFLPEDTFSFLKKIPVELSHSVYCPRCFDDNVASPLATYNETMEKAKEVIVFLKNEGKKTRLLARKEEPYIVLDCLDKEETLLRLAFYAAQENFNSIIDVDITHEKVINGSHKHFVWKGTAMPCQLDDKMLNAQYYD